jgi:hypothetical protein
MRYPSKCTRKRNLTKMTGFSALLGFGLETMYFGPGDAAVRGGITVGTEDF